MAAQLSVIVISYNTRAMTLACLAALFAQTQTPCEVIVVDNASSDGSAAAIAAAFPQVTLLAQTQNHGFGRAHHLAMPYATAPWVLLLNPDTLVLNGAVDHLLDFAKDTPDAGIWGGRTLHGDGRLNAGSCWGRMTLWSLFGRASGISVVFAGSELCNPENIGGWLRDTTRQVDIVSGCFLLLKRATWDALGGFDPVFVMYGEEADLCLRGRAIGLRPMVTPTAEIIHYGAASEPVRADKMVRLLTAKMTLITRHFPRYQQWFARFLLRMWPLSRLLALRGLAGLTADPDHRAKAAEWAQVWVRRAEWQTGFPAA